MTSKHLLISGKVHGVGFRYNLQHRATASGLTGWCRNLPDGRLEALLQGDEDAVDVVAHWCHEGPVSAQVEHVEIRDAQTEEKFPDFEILPTPARSC